MPAIELLYQAALDMPAARTCIINAHAHPLLADLQQQTQLLALQQHFKPEYTALQRNHLSVSPDWPEPAERFDLILLLPAKNKQQTRGWLAAALHRLSDTGRLMVAAANTHGARSYATALQQLTGQITSRSKSKCRIFSARKTAAFDTALTEQWMNDAQPQYLEPHGLGSHGLYTQAGLFSWDRADTGSSLLLQQLPALSGKGMDLCCGYGLLSEHILRHPNTVSNIHLVEADHLALNCAKQNMAKRTHPIQYHWLDAAHDPLPQGLDWIVCNPPFHSGQTRDVELGQHIAQRGCESLKRGGVLYLVANRKLPYERLLQSALHQCQTLIEADGFKVIQGIR